MIVTANKYVNARIGSPFTNAPNPFFRDPGYTFEVIDIVPGTEIEGNPIWYKNKEDNAYYWSGGVQEGRPAYFKDFGIDSIWQETMGQGVKVYVVDSGMVNYDGLQVPEQNLLSVISDTDKYDALGHGTFMGSIIAGTGASNLGIATKSELFSIKFTDKETGFNETLLLNALQKVSNLIKPNDYSIINLSLDLGIILGHSFSNLTSILQEIISKSNTIIVAAVGNKGLIGEEYKTFPAGIDNVILVAGLNDAPNYIRLSSSNGWEAVTIAAPGTYPKSILNNKFTNIGNQGSSHACAFISGLISLICSKAKSKNIHVSANFILQFLRKSASISIQTSTDGSIYKYYKLDKTNLINTFKSI